LNRKAPPALLPLTSLPSGGANRFHPSLSARTGNLPRHIGTLTSGVVDARPQSIMSWSIESDTQPSAEVLGRHGNLLRVEAELEGLSPRQAGVTEGAA